jgi:hypothetical protein
MQFAKFLALAAIVAVLAPFGSMQPASAENYLCRQQFALCTSAPCIPQPGSTKVAMCTCDVKDGPADAFADGTDFFMKSLNIKKSPVQACPTR